MPNLEDLLVLESDVRPVFGDGVAEASDVLRAAIGQRRWDDALQAAAHLAAVSDTVLGMMRSRGTDEPLPPASTFEELDELVNHGLLGLSISAERWAEFVDGYAFSQLAVGWWNPMDHLAVAMVGTDPPWPALLAELEAPGSFPLLREVCGAYGRPWERVAHQPWFDEVPPEVASIDLATPDARHLLAMTRGLTVRSVFEMRVLAHTLKYDERRLLAALEELQRIGFAEAPASARTLAIEYSTVADLKSIAARAGISPWGRKAQLVDRFLEAGLEESLAAIVNHRRVYAPVVIGPANRALTPARAVASLWVAAWDDVGSPGLCADGDEDDQFWEVPPNAPVSPPDDAAWQVTLGGSIERSLVAGDQLVVLTTGPEVRAIGLDGSERWRLPIHGAELGEFASLIEHDREILVGLADRVVALSGATGIVSWTWLADAGLTREVVPAAEMVLVTTSNGLRVLDSGVLRWQFDRKGLSLPVVEGDLVVTMRAGSTLNVLRLDNGAIEVRKVLDAVPKVWVPLVQDGLLLCGGELAGGVVVGAIDLRTGEPDWFSTLGGWPRFELATPPPKRVRTAILACRDRSDVPYQARLSLMFLFRGLGLDEDPHDRATPTNGVVRRYPSLRFIAELRGIAVVGLGDTLWGIGAPEIDLVTEPQLGDIPTNVFLSATLDLGESLAFSAGDLPAIVQRGDLVVVAGASAVTGINRSTGAVSWRSDVVADGLHLAGSVCLAVWAEHITALTASDGIELWSRQLESEILAMAHDDSQILVGLGNGSAVPLDPSTGRSVWPRSEPLDLDESYRHGHAAEACIVEGVFVWRRGLGDLAAVCVETGAAEAIPELLDSMHPWMYQCEHNEVSAAWGNERRFAEGRVAVLSSGGLSDEQRGRLVIHRPKMEPAIIDLPPGYAHSETCVAADGDGITVVAEAVSSDPRRLEVLLYRPE